MPYSFHRFLIDFKTPPLSPLHADTMFGHLCWALKAVNGEEALLSFLQQMQGSDPLIILSDLLLVDICPNVSTWNVPKLCQINLKTDQETSLHKEG